MYKLVLHYFLQLNFLTFHISRGMTSAVQLVVTTEVPYFGDPIEPATKCGKVLFFNNLGNSRSQRPRGLRRWSEAARLLGLWVLIPPWTWMSVCCECCVLSGRDLCVGLISRPEESYRVWCV